MFKSIPGNNEYLISLTGEIRNYDGSVPSINVIDGKIEIVLYGSKVNVDLKWLALISHFELYLPNPSFKNLLNVNFFDTNITFFRPVSGKIPVFNKPVIIQSEGKKYRVIPSFPKYAIDCFGEIIEIYSLEKVKIIFDKKRNNLVVDLYPSVYIYNPEKQTYKYVYVHRLVAMAWVNNRYNDYVTRPIVNHIDGNKKNFYYKNLEWCSFRENNIHAVNTGLKSDNVKCKIRDFYTKIVRSFDSLSQAEQYMGLKEKKLRVNNFPDKKGKLLNGRYEIKLDSDKSPWFYENRTEKVKLGRYMITVEYQDGNIEYFYDTRDFKDKFKTWNCPNLLTMINLAKSSNPGVKFTITDFHHNQIIQAYNVITNNIIETKTISDMSEKLNIPEYIIRTCLRSSETRVKYNYAFRYKSDSPWDTKFIYYEKPKIGVKAFNKLTKEELYFDSIRKTAKHFKVDRTWIRNCLINNYSLNNWAITKIEG